MWEKELCRPQGQWRRGRRCSRSQSRGSSAAREDQGEADCPPEAHGGPQWSRNPPAAHGEPHAGAGGCPWRKLWLRGELVLEQAPARTCGPMERGAHIGTDLLAGLVTPWGTHAGAVSEELQPMGRTHIGEFHGRLSPVDATPCWSRGRAWGVLPLRRKEQQRQRVMNGPQPPFPIPLWLLWGGGREFGSEVKPRKKGGMGGRCYKICFYISLSCSYSIANKVNSFPKLSLFCLC